MSLDDILKSPELATLGAIMLEESKQKIQRKYAALNQLADREGIVMAGDSIVEGFPLQEFFERKIYNRGISGDTSAELLKRLPETVLPLKPQTVLFWIGTNDLQDRISPEQICSNLEQAGKAVEKACSAKVIVVSVAPVNGHSRDDRIRNTVGIRDNRDIQQLNRLYCRMCEKNGWKYVDVYPLLSENGSLQETMSEDGLHPNIEGYIPVAKEITAALNAL